MEVYFVTGASKGIGNELVKQLLDEGHYVVGVARSNIEVDGVHSIQGDLSIPSNIEKIAEEFFKELPENITSLTLINNAGVIDPIGKVGSIDEKDLAMSVTVNLTAPMMLSSAFINKFKAFNGPKRIVNISSGAGGKPYEGWSSYCATKAGLDHFSRVVAVEQESEMNPVKIVSIAPGIIDTGMQEKIRSSEENDFPLVEQFKNYKTNALLSSPAETASKLIEFMRKIDLVGKDPILDLRNL